MVVWHRLQLLKPPGHLFHLQGQCVHGNRWNRARTHAQEHLHLCHSEKPVLSETGDGDHAQKHGRMVKRCACCLSHGTGQHFQWGDTHACSRYLSRAS